MSLLCSKLDDSTSLRENTRVLAVSYRIHPCFLLPPPICLISSSSTFAVTNFAAATLISLLYFKHDSHTPVWNTAPNAYNIGFYSNVTFSMGYPLITNEFYTMSHTSNLSTSLILSIALPPFDKYCTF